MKIQKLFLIVILVQSLFSGCQSPSPASLPTPIASEPSASPTSPVLPTRTASEPPASPIQTPFAGISIESKAVATLYVDGFPDWLAIAAGSVWVSNALVGIQRIDTATNQVIATIPVDNPCAASAAGYGSLWVQDCFTMQLVRIDLQSNEVIARIKLWIADAEGSIAAGEGGVWVLSDKKGVLSRVDPEKNEVVAEIAVNEGSFTVMTGFGSVWTTQSSGSVSTTRTVGTVQRIDPKTNQVVASIEVRLGPRFIAVGEGGVWVLNALDGSVTRIDPNTNQVVAVIEHVTDGLGVISPWAMAPFGYEGITFY